MFNLKNPNSWVETDNLTETAINWEESANKELTAKFSLKKLPTKRNSQKPSRKC